jgi:hypothetical protein
MAEGFTGGLASGTKDTAVFNQRGEIADKELGMRQQGLDLEKAKFDFAQKESLSKQETELVFNTLHKVTEAMKSGLMPVAKQLWNGIAAEAQKRGKMMPLWTGETATGEGYAEVEFSDGTKQRFPYGEKTKPMEVSGGVYNPATKSWDVTPPPKEVGGSIYSYFQPSKGAPDEKREVSPAEPTGSGAVSDLGSAGKQLQAAGWTATGTKKRDEKWTDWGDGHKRNLETGEVVGVPVKPEKEPKDPGAAQAKVGTINQIDRAWDEKWFSLARKNLEKSGEPGKKALADLQVLFGQENQFGGSVVSARLRDVLNDEQKGNYDSGKIRAQELAAQYPPAVAVNKALEEIAGKRGGIKQKAGGGPGLAQERKTLNGKSYVKIKGQWFEE